MYQTFEADPRESAKPLRFDSFQVAFAPGAPGALPAARAGPAVATALPVARASAVNKLAARSLVCFIVSPPPAGPAGRACASGPDEAGQMVSRTT